MNEDEGMTTAEQKAYLDMLHAIAAERERRAQYPTVFWSPTDWKKLFDREVECLKRQAGSG